MRLEGDWRADGYLIARELFDAPRVASLLEISEHCRARWMELNPEWGGPGNPQPRGSPPPSAEQLATARSMRHLNHPDYFEGGAQSEQFATLMEAVADPDVQSLATSVIGPLLFRSTTLFFNPTQGSRDGDWVNQPGHHPLVAPHSPHTPLQPHHHHPPTNAPPSGSGLLSGADAVTRVRSQHRDSQFTIPVEEQEQLFLQQLRSSGLITRSAGIQMQIALVPNDDVELVPGSVRPNAFVHGAPHLCSTHRHF